VGPRDGDGGGGFWGVPFSVVLKRGYFRVGTLGWVLFSGHLRVSTSRWVLKGGYFRVGTLGWLL
jgi:hypothetical protein